MKLKSILTVAAIAGVMPIGLAYADHEAGHEGCQKGAMFKEADTNGDGKVSYDEFKAMRDKHGEEMFKRMDANADGFVDEAERKAMHDKYKDRCMRKSEKK